MKKVLATLWTVALAALAATVVSAAAAGKAPETTTIDDCVAKKAAVAFPHAAHVKVAECKTCHHNQATLTAQSAEEVKPCGACHVAPEKPETPKCSEMSLAKNPFHINCIGCHKAEVAKNATTKAPTKCDQCHPKAKA
jgi:hypothetical protein